MAQTRRVLRPDIYLEAMKEMGVAAKVTELSKVTLFDSTLDGAEPEQYARSFPISSLSQSV